MKLFEDRCRTGWEKNLHTQTQQNVTVKMKDTDSGQWDPQRPVSLCPALLLLSASPGSLNWGM